MRYPKIVINARGTEKTCYDCNLVLPTWNENYYTDAHYLREFWRKVRSGGPVVERNWLSSTTRYIRRRRAGRN